MSVNCLSISRSSKQLPKVSVRCLEHFQQIIIKASVAEFIFSKVPCFHHNNSKNIHLFVKNCAPDKSGVVIHIFPALLLYAQITSYVQELVGFFYSH